MPPLKTNFDKALERIKKRNWSELRRQWIEFIPHIYPSGSPPKEPVTNFYRFHHVAHKTIDSDVHREEVIGLRQLVFWEGVFLLHKASHVVGSAELHASKGIQTWALSSGYHGALFGVKAIIHMLGVAIPEYKGEDSYNNKAILVDLWPELPKLSRKQIMLGMKNEPEMEFSKLGLRIQNRHVWRTFKRIINVSKVDVWPPEYVKALRKLKPSEFALQRNAIHYQNHMWIYEDLHEFILDERFGIPRKTIIEALNFKIKKSDFSLVLGLAIFKLGLLLLKSLSQLTNKLEDEISILESHIANEERHPIYLAGYC
jgi:hypothetical protein